MNTLSNITLKQIRTTWRYLYITPTGGKLYFSDEHDACAVIYSDYTKLYTNRSIPGFTPHCFRDQQTIHTK